MGFIEPIRWVDLSMQIVTFILVIYGYVVFKRKRGLMRHAYAFTAATLLNLFAVLFLMGPSFLEHLHLLSAPAMEFNALLLWAHHFLGAGAMVLSVFIVVRWAAHKGKARHCRGKLLMNFTMIIWMITLILGFWFIVRDVVEP